MTREDREESISILKKLIPKDSRGNGKVKTNIAITEAILNAFEALEQEPCEDCISRQAVLDLMQSLTRWCVRSEDGKFNNVGLLYDDVMFGVDKLPSVNPQEPKTGHWIMTSDYLTAAYGSIDYVKCSCCGEDSLEEGNYCPNCGAKMESEG